MYLWWPGITRDIEERVQNCSECQLHQSHPPVAPLHPWAWPTRPWARLHIDYAGPINGQMVLIIIDAHSKYIEAIPTSGSTSIVVIEEMRTLFGRFGIPESIVSDNGTCFTSEEFRGFLKQNGVTHILSAPYHPSTNGLAERAVQVVKRGLRKVTQGSLRSRIATVLFSYRLTAQSTTGQSPSELLLGRRPRNRLDLLRPNAAERVERQQAKQAQQHNAASRDRRFETGDRVFVRNYQQGEQWVPGIIQNSTGPVSFRVKLQDGRVRRCHLDQVRSRSVNVPQVVEWPNVDVPTTEPVPTKTPEAPQPRVPEREPIDQDTATVPDPRTPSRPSTSVKVYPKRSRKTVDRNDPSKI